MLGVIFALSFCPFSAVLFFAMLIPLALGAGDPGVIPAVFAFAMGLPVIVISYLLVKGVGKCCGIVQKIRAAGSLHTESGCCVFYCSWGVLYRQNLRERDTLNSPYDNGLSPQEHFKKN
jgi:hypothetical protein